MQIPAIANILKYCKETKFYQTEITSKSGTQTTYLSKTYQKEVPKRPRFFCLLKTHQNEHVEAASVFHRNCIKICIKRTLNFCRNYNVKTIGNIWNKIENYGLEKKSLVSIFAYFLTAIATV